MPPWAPLNAAPTSWLLAGPAGTPGFPSLRCAARRRPCAPSGHCPRAWAAVVLLGPNTRCRCSQGCGRVGTGANGRRRAAQGCEGCPPRSGGTARIAEHRCPRSGQKGEFRSRPRRPSSAGQPARRVGRRRLSVRARPPAALLAPTFARTAATGRLRTSVRFPVRCTGSREAQWITEMPRCLLRSPPLPPLLCESRRSPRRVGIPISMDTPTPWTVPRRRRSRRTQRFSSAVWYRALISW